MGLLLFSARHLQLALEAIESALPQAPVGGDPHVDLAERFRPEPIQAPLGIDADVDETRVTEHAEVLRDGGLAHRQPGDELANRALAVAQQVEDAATVRFGEELEGGDHGG